MEAFLYMPHVFYVAEFGAEHFEASMRAQYELTQRFTAEYSIRVFLECFPERTLARLREWAHDESVHVRRLVSEGTRPRLPWAPRLRAFQADPRPVLELLDLLKDDPELYVRRSVANNLNDIGKDNPAVLIETCRRWAQDATAERRWLIRHALRSAVKRGEPAALEILGFGEATAASVREIRVVPAVVPIGESVTFAVELANEGSSTERLLVDLRVHFVKANGRPGPKVFKLKELELQPQASAHLVKTISLAQHTTRTHYPGRHRVEVLVNGRASATYLFDVVAERRPRRSRDQRGSDHASNRGTRSAAAIPARPSRSIRAASARAHATSPAALMPYGGTAAYPSTRSAARRSSRTAPTGFPRCACVNPTAI